MFLTITLNTYIGADYAHHNSTEVGGGDEGRQEGSFTHQSPLRRDRPLIRLEIRYLPPYPHHLPPPDESGTRTPEYTPRCPGCGWRGRRTCCIAPTPRPPPRPRSRAPCRAGTATCSPARAPGQGGEVQHQGIPLSDSTPIVHPNLLLFVAVITNGARRRKQIICLIWSW